MQRDHRGPGNKHSAGEDQAAGRRRHRQAHLIERVEREPCCGTASCGCAVGESHISVADADKRQHRARDTTHDNPSQKHRGKAQRHRTDLVRRREQAMLQRQPGRSAHPQRRRHTVNEPARWTQQLHQGNSAAGTNDTASHGRQQQRRERVEARRALRGQDSPRRRRRRHGPPQRAVCACLEGTAEKQRRQLRHLLARRQCERLLLGGARTGAGQRAQGVRVLEGTPALALVEVRALGELVKTAGACDEVSVRPFAAVSAAICRGSLQRVRCICTVGRARGVVMTGRLGRNRRAPQPEQRGKDARHPGAIGATVHASTGAQKSPARQRRWPAASATDQRGLPSNAQRSSASSRKDSCATTGSP